MKLSQFTIEQIIEMFGKPIRYPSDYMELSLAIEKTVGQPISTNTVKRLLGFIVEDREPRLYTLDIISKYLGYENWDNYVMSDTHKVSQFKSFGGIFYFNLRLNDQIEFHYLPDRKALIQYSGKRGVFQVVKAENSKLQVGDEISVSQFLLNHPVFMKKVMRNGDNLGSYVAGKAGGLSFLKKIPAIQDISPKEDEETTSN